MKNLYAILPIILLLFGAVIFIIFDSKDQSLEEPIVYYIPHQDDEILTFGVSIYDNLQKGKEVYIVLLTNGAGSNVRKQLNLTKEEFTAARNNEMEKALQELGFDLQNLIRKNYEDGALTVEQVEQVMKEYAIKFPNAMHSTFSYHDPHPDHSNAGIALNDLQKEGLLENAKFYIGNNYTPPENLTIQEDYYEDSYYPFIVAASRSYGIVNEKDGFYGIGWKSVPEYFKTLEADPKSIYHQ